MELRHTKPYPIASLICIDHVRVIFRRYFRGEGEGASPTLALPPTEIAPATPARYL